MKEIYLVGLHHINRKLGTESGSIYRLFLKARAAFLSSLLLCFIYSRVYTVMLVHYN